MQTLKVLHVGKFYPPHMGGIETHLRGLCTELRRSVDIEVIVASEARCGIEEELNGVPICRVPTWLTVASTPICPGMISRLRAFRGDIVHLHLPNPVGVVAYLASGHKGHLIVTYHSDMVRQRYLGRAFEPFLHAALRRTSAIITTSPNYLETSSVLARHKERCRVIPLGIRIEDFEHCDLDAVASLRQRYGERLIVSVGRLVYYKGFEYLVRAMPWVQGNLLIVGQGPLRSRLSALAAEVGVSDRVHFLGKISHDQLVACYHAASIFAFPSVARSEAFGIAQVEAMAAGLPVINTNIGSGVPFVSLHGQTGLTVPPADPGVLANAINCILDNPDLRASFGQAARVRARHEFSLEAMVSRTLALYQDVSAFRNIFESDILTPVPTRGDS